MARLLRQNFETARGKFDLYIPFIERSLQLFGPAGRASLITPNKFLVTEYGEALRQMLDRGGLLSGLIDFSDLQLFRAATNYVAITFLSAEPVASPLKLRKECRCLEVFVFQ